MLKKFTVQTYEVVRNPDPKSPPVMYGGQAIPKDMVPKQKESFDIHARNHDHARKLVRDEFKKKKRSVRSVSFAANDKVQIIVYVFKE